MNSEKTFIKYYSSFWNQLLPGIDHYVRMINSGLKERHYTPITYEGEDIPSRRALINGISFKLFYHFYEQKTNPRDMKSLVDKNIDLIKELQFSEAERMEILDNSDNFKDELTNTELDIVIKLAHRLLSFSNGKQDFEIYPKFQGCGLLFECTGDIRLGKTLVEIKAGNGNITKYDLYQLLIYGALNSVSNEPYDIQRFYLFNIRTGVEWNEEIETVCEIIAGESSAEIYSEIINYITNNYTSI